MLEHLLRVCFFHWNEGVTMQFITSFAVQLPLMIACVVFVIAAMFKVGKEKGAGLIAAGAVGLCLLVIIGPLFNSLVMSRIVAEMDPQAMSYAFLIKQVIFNFLWASSVALVATGTFLRPPALEGNSQGNSIPLP
tara:strand:- start:66 stop:470 length:405 start_codon:yes stop_codon:yes gene_type:complete